jgi:hypothetical protein
MARRARERWGAGPVPDEDLAVLVGDPLSTLRAEAAGVLQLLTQLSDHLQYY